jgi:hypothetical protein
MKFFDYIFISGYRAYKRYDRRRSDPRFHAVILVFCCINSLWALLFEILDRLLGNKHIKNFILNHPILILTIACLLVVALYQYYSGKRIADLTEKFEKQSKVSRILWGWIAALTFLLPMILFALLLNHII